MNTENEQVEKEQVENQEEAKPVSDLEYLQRVNAFMTNDVNQLTEYLYSLHNRIAALEKDNNND